MSTSISHSLAVLGAVLAFLALALLVRAAPRGQDVPAGAAGLSWSVLGAGGGHTSSASYSLDATLGQPLAGVSTGPTTRLTAGFWQEAVTYRVYVPWVSR